MTDEVMVLARTLYAEARTEGVPGMEALACVLLNRVNTAKAARRNGIRPWFGETIEEACKELPCWRPDNPNLAKLLAMRGGDAQFSDAITVAARAIAGRILDPTGGATALPISKRTP